MSDLLKLENIDKYYEGPAGSRMHVLDRVELKITKEPDSGRFITIAAPDGSGKSTLLKIIAQVEKQDKGKVLLNGKEYGSPGGGIAYIPEESSSYLWMNVIENLRSAESAAGKQSKSKTEQIIELTGLTGYEQHIPHEKSKGFRFRIALGRALMSDPAVLLLDDSLRGMDETTKQEIVEMILRIVSEMKLLMILGSGSLNNAARLSDSVMLMSRKPGRIIKEIMLKGSVDDRLAELKKEVEQIYEQNSNINPLNFSM